MANLESVMCLTRSEPKLISPAFETQPQNEEALYLSELDLSYQKYVEFILVYPKSDCRFPNTREPLEEVLAKALVFYYPFAGRYRESVDGRLEVLCNGGGVLFTEARSQCTLDRVAYLDEPYIPFDDSSIFIPTDPTLPRQLLPLVTFQVTKFMCGGHVLGIKASHIVTDGRGFSQFLKTLVEIAMGKDGPSVLPIWQRERLMPRDPPLFNPLTFSSGYLSMKERVFEHKSRLTFHIPNEITQRVKSTIVRESMGEINRCSTFEALTSVIWIVYAKIMDLNNCHFSFPMNVRNLVVDPSFRDGYYGNAVIYVDVKEAVPEDVKFWHVTRAIKNAKASVDEEYVKSVIDLFSTVDKDKTMLHEYLLRTNMIFDDWTRYFGAELEVEIPQRARIPNFRDHPQPTWCFFLPKNQAQEPSSIMLLIPTRVLPHFKTELHHMIHQFSSLIA